MIKKIGIALAALVGLFLIVGLITPKEFHMERSIVINKPVGEVFAYLQPLKNQEQWSPWAKKDPNMKKSYQGEDGVVGFISSWDGNKEVGAGSQEIMKIIPGDRIEYELRFKKPMEATDSAYITTHAINPTQTRVSWGMDGHTPFPGNVICLVMNMKSKLAKDFDEGLVSLKGILESRTTSPSQEMDTL